jgi:hypothetical protein
MVLIHKNCDPLVENNKSLPRNSYLVTYQDSKDVKYDIVQAGSFVEVFDNYYDQYGKNSIIKIQWSQGTVNPKSYNYQVRDKKSKK